ncbi:plasmid mobilization relaxosome protein MobC [Arthrobacter sp. Z1-15]
MSESKGIAGWKSRRRRANVPGGRLHRHIVKVSPEEEAQLVQIAGRHRVTVVRLLVESALSESDETPSERRDQFMELSNLARLVGTVANNVNQVARHANSTGEIPADAAASIAHAKSVIYRVDRLLAEMAGR